MNGQENNRKDVSRAGEAGETACSKALSALSLLCPPFLLVPYFRFPLLLSTSLCICLPTTVYTEMVKPPVQLQSYTDQRYLLQQDPRFLVRRIGVPPYLFPSPPHSSPHPSPTSTLCPPFLFPYLSSINTPFPHIHTPPPRHSAPQKHHGNRARAHTHTESRARARH